MHWFNKTVLWSLVALAAAIGVNSTSAAVITWDGGGGGGAGQIWNVAANWSDDSAPSASNDYIVNSATIRSLDASSSSFGGGSLTVQNGAVLNFYRSNGGTLITSSHTIPSLAINNAVIAPQSSGGSVNHQLLSPVTLLGNNTLNMTVGGGFSMGMFFNGPILGSGTLTVNRNATGTGRTFRFAGDASGYSGDIVFSSSVAEILRFEVNNAGGWGTGDLTVGNYGTLDLNTAFVSLASTLNMTGSNAVLNLNTDVTVNHFNLYGNNLAYGVYTAADLTALGFGGTFNGAGSIAVVPEPASGVLAARGGMALALAYRRHRGAAKRRPD